MTQQLVEIARDLKVSDRSLRRGVSDGLLRAERTGPRKISLPLREELYVRRHWPLLSGLRQLLRTQHNVRLAVLFGSMASGEEHEGSDIDLLVVLEEDDYRRHAQLRRMLERSLGRELDVISLSEAQTNPILMTEVLADGRVLVDRDERWPGLRRRARVIRRAAVQAERDLLARETAALAELRAEGVV